MLFKVAEKRNFGQHENNKIRVLKVLNIEVIFNCLTLYLILHYRYFYSYFATFTEELG